MRIEQPAFPLAISSFASALRTGHGRAMQQIVNCGPSGLEGVLVGACVSSLSYDPQCEAERAPWLSSMVERAKLTAEVLNAIEAGAQALSSENHWDMEQRSGILKELAATGSNDARRLLYLSLARSSNTSDVVGAEQIVALDGMEGLKYVARQLGRWLQADPEFWVDDWLAAQFDESTGIEGGFAMLECEAKVDADIASYLEGIRKTRESQGLASNRFDVAAYDGTGIVAHARMNPKDQCHWFRQWAAQASSGQRETVFAALLMSDDPQLVKRLCRCFAKTGVPRFESRLLRWIADPDVQVQWAAVRAVASVTHAELRRAALREIAGGDLAVGIALLVNNSEAGDFALCVEHLQRIEGVDEIHRLVGELLDLCAAHPGADALDCLLYVYEFSPCSTCRCRAVKAMMETGTAPVWVQVEASFDADPDTRDLVRGTLGLP